MDYPITNEFFCERPDDAETAKRMLVMGNRILSTENVFDAFGHISIRNPENPETFFISRALSPDAVTVNDLVEMDFGGKIVSGPSGCRPYGESAIHCAIYAARPDVASVCHPHPLEIIPFASMDIPLRSIYHLDVTFYDGIPVFKDIPPECGLLINRLDVARALARELGTHRGILIRNHGVVVTGESLPRCVYSTITMRDNASMLLKCMAAGKEVHYIGREEAEYGFLQEICRLGLPRSWDYWCRRAKKAFDDIACLDV